MGKFISNLFLGAMAIGLTIFTATRTLDLLSQWLPVNQQIMQWLGLVAFEGGFYFWAFFFAMGAKGDAQRGIALVMTVICFIGISVATIMDLVLVGADSGKLPAISPNMKFTVVVFVGVIIVLNVAAFMAAKLCDVDRLKLAAEQSAEDMIHSAGLRAIHKIGPQIATAAAPQIAEEWAQATWQKILPGAARPVQQFIEAPQQPQLQRTVVTSVPQQQQVQRGGGLFGKIGGRLLGGKGASTLTPASLPQTATVANPPAPTHVSASTASLARAQMKSRRIQGRRSARMLAASKVAAMPTPVLQQAASQPTGNGATQPKKARTVRAKTGGQGGNIQTKP